ncbi:MAG: minor capsid protein [Planctomycetaceae bacterium]|nr:minor capsid protein [Planctomycetaceae bacterium]
MNGLTDKQLDDILKYQPLGGKTINDWFANIASQDITRINAAITAGMNEESLSIPQILKNVFGEQGAVSASRKQMKMAARTLTIATANHSKMESYKAVMADGSGDITGVEWSAFFDGRECIVCATKNGKRWTADEINDVPIPPLHPNCRCSLIPFNDESDEGELDEGILLQDATFDDWLKEQTEEFQKDRLGTRPIPTLDGKSRYELWKEGKIKADDLVHPDSGFRRTTQDLIDFVNGKPFEEIKSESETKIERQQKKIERLEKELEEAQKKLAAAEQSAPISQSPSQQQKAEFDFSVTEADTLRVNPNVKRTYDIESAADVEGFLRTKKQQELARELIDLKLNHPEQANKIFDTDRRLREEETRILHDFLLGDTQDTRNVKTYLEAFERRITKLNFGNEDGGKIAEKELKKDGKKGIEFVSRLMERFGIDVQKPPPKLVRKGDRPSYDPVTNELDLDKLTEDFGQHVVHEYGHYIEDNLPNIKRKCQEFLSEITKGQMERLLKDDMPGFDLRPDEKYKLANIDVPSLYSTKIMDDGTEILTEGLKALYNNPAKFARECPDYFNFTLSLLNEK